MVLLLFGVEVLGKGASFSLVGIEGDSEPTRLASRQDIRAGCVVRERIYAQN